MSTKDIRPSVQHTICDVCGRTLLRGEHPEPYIAGGERRWVCDLCTSRALQEGWIREGTVPEYNASDSGRDRRRPLFGWLRSRRGGNNGPAARAEEFPEPGMPAAPAPAPPPPVPAAAREPRHVHAIPSSDGHKIAVAIDIFNSSEHARTIAGVARSLGSPAVSVRPSIMRPSVVNVVASWELTWYRYEIDLADEESGVRVAGQGAELSELAPEEREGNAGADENGLLALREPGA